MWRGVRKPSMKKEVIIIIRVEYLCSIHKPMTSSNYIESRNEESEVFKS